MQILRVTIENFRSIRKLEFFPQKHNVFIGPNNIGKTAIVEAINLCLNPEFSLRSEAVDENDFYNRVYIKKTKVEGEEFETLSYPKIRIDIVLGPVPDDDELIDYRAHLVAWNIEDKNIVEPSEERENPFEGNMTAIRVCFEAQYDPAEDEFVWHTFFKASEGDEWVVNSEHNPKSVSREIKRQIGFLIYRDVRGSQRPITLEPHGLLMRVAKSQDALPQNFEDAFHNTKDSLSALSVDTNFGRVLAEVRNEIDRFLTHALGGETKLRFELTDRTRSEFKSTAQLYVDGNLELPSQKYGAGTRSLISLSLLTYIVRTRGRGILTLEEPETFLYPHAQRRVISESLKISNQVFVTTHSPFVLEQFAPEAVGRVFKDNDGTVRVNYLKDNDRKFFRRNLRKQLSEALLSRAVVVTEEDSIAKWIYSSSQVCHGQTIEEVEIENFDLLGISVVSAEGNGSVIPLAEFLEGAGLPVLICVDKAKPNAKIESWKSQGKPHVEFTQTGIERLFLDEIAFDKLLDFVTTDQVESINPLNRERVMALSTENQKKEVLKFLMDNKGSLPFHDWMVSQLDHQSLPATIKQIVKVTMGLI